MDDAASAPSSTLSGEIAVKSRRRSRGVRGASLVGIAIVAVMASAVFVHAPSAGADTDPATLVGEGGSSFTPVIQALLRGDQSSLSPLSGAYTYVVDDGTASGPNLDFAGSAPGDFAADYVVSEGPLTTAESSQAQANGRTFAYVPIAATPVAVVTLVPTPAFASGDESTITSSDLCQGMPLTLTQLADLYGFDATNPLLNWSGTDSAGNPLSCDASGTPVATEPVSLWANADATPENETLMSLLDSTPTSKALFDAGLLNASKNSQGLTTDDTPSLHWPYAQNTIAGGDQPLIGKLIAIDTNTNAPIDSPALWQLGATAPISSVWTDAPLGVSWDLPTAAIQNAQGAFVTPSTASATAAEADATLAATSDPTTDNLVTFVPSTTDTAAYNNYLMMEEYLVVPTNSLPAAKATSLAQLIRFAVGTTGQKIIASFGAAPATTAMVTADLKVAAQLTSFGLGQASSTTTTTTAAAATTGTTSPGGGSGAAPAGGTSAATGSGDATNDPGAGQGAAAALAFTGSNPLPLVALGAALVVVAGFGRRRLLRRLAASLQMSPASTPRVTRRMAGEKR